MEQREHMVHTQCVFKKKKKGYLKLESDDDHKFLSCASIVYTPNVQICERKDYHPIIFCSTPQRVVKIYGKLENGGRRSNIKWILWPHYCRRNPDFLKEHTAPNRKDHMC